MNIQFSRIAILALATTAVAQPASAQSAGTPDKRGSHVSGSDATPASAGTATDALMLGYQLADYARTTRDARAMIAAARIVDRVTVKEGADKGKIEGAGSGAAQMADMKPLMAAALFDEATALAQGDQDILSAIAAARAEASRGIIWPAIRTVQHVPKDTTWTVRFMARGGQPLVVGARRDATTAVDLKIYDENGNLVCQDMSHNVTLYCRINPIWTGAYSVQLINHGESGTGMALVTN